MAIHGDFSSCLHRCAGTDLLQSHHALDHNLQLSGLCIHGVRCCRTRSRSKLAAAALQELWGSIKLPHFAILRELVMKPRPTLEWSLYCNRQRWCNSPLLVRRCLILHVARVSSTHCHPRGRIHGWYLYLHWLYQLWEQAWAAVKDRSQAVVRRRKWSCVFIGRFQWCEQSWRWGSWGKFPIQLYQHITITNHKSFQFYFWVLQDRRATLPGKWPQNHHVQCGWTSALQKWSDLVVSLQYPEWECKALSRPGL